MRKDLKIWEEIIFQYGRPHGTRGSRGCFARNRRFENVFSGTYNWLYISCVNEFFVTIIEPAVYK